MLAPMAGITDSAFRRLAKKGGADVVFTEMLSAVALAHDSKRTTEMLKFSDEEKPIIAQIFGSDVSAIEKSVHILAQLGFNGINLNFGCPARKIMKSSSGSAALKNPEVYEKVLTAAVKSAEPHKISISVKTRPGLTPDKNISKEIARITEDCGASMLILHGRFASQKHSGDVSIESISEAVKSVKIPVIANGGISDEETARNILDKTGCAGLMIGRSAIGDFGIFRRISHYLKSGDKLMSPSREERIAAYKEHAKLSAELHGEKRGVIILRKLAAFYLKGLPGAKTARGLINKAETLVDFEKALDAVFAADVQTSSSDEISEEVLTLRED